jgi:hypothetical protein
MLKYSAMVLLLGLAACGLVRAQSVSSMSLGELQQVSDDDLCNLYVEETTAVVTERQRRGLGDCSVAHRTCVRSSYQPGTAPYLQCRQYIAEEEEAQRRGYAGMMAIGTGIMQQNQPSPPSRPVTTSCRRMGQFIQCTTY